MQQVGDFIEETEILAGLLDGLKEEDWTRATQFKAWTVNDVVVHLLFWNRAAELARTNPEKFQQQVAELAPLLKTGGMRAHENAQIAERGRALLAEWRHGAAQMAAHWRKLDPKTRMKWAGPEMAARTLMSARQMEIWAHGQSVFDIFGRLQPQSDRLQNIVFLGVSAFSWSHIVHGRPIPITTPELRLTAPSGAQWRYGDPHSGALIEGSAVEFAQVVTQTRNIADTELKLSGEIATNWMSIAQCFAGPPENPPAPGMRFLKI